MSRKTAEARRAHDADLTGATTRAPARAAGAGNAAHARYASVRGEPAEPTDFAAGWARSAPPDPWALQLKATADQPANETPDPHAVAEAGFAGSPAELPHRARIEAGLGADLSGVKAYVGGPAADAAGQLGAHAYAMGDRVAFAGPPDLHTAAHEAAHVVQQQGGVQLKDALGRPGDAYEREADAAADAVVAGAEPSALSATVGQPVQRKDSAPGGNLDSAPPAIRSPVAGEADGNPFSPACEADPQNSECFLTEAQRSVAENIVTNRFGNLRECYANAIGAESMRAHIEEKLAPEGSLLGILIDAVFVVAPFGMSELLGRAAKGLVKIAKDQKPSDHLLIASIEGILEGLLDSEVRDPLKSLAAPVASKQALQDWLTNYDAEVRARVNGMLETALRLDDAGLIAAYVWSDDQYHTLARYQGEVRALVDAFESDVDTLGSRTLGFTRTAVEIVGPTGARRVAIGELANPTGTAIPRQFFFDHWARDGFGDLAMARQSQIDANRERFTLPGQSKKASPTGLTFQWNEVADPAVQEWAAMTLVPMSSE